MPTMQREVLLKTLRQFGGQDNCIVIPRSFVDFTGSLEAGMMLSQLLYWSDRSKTANRIYKTDAEWMQELSLKQYSVRQARATLEKMDIISTEVHRANGQPTVHYYLKEDILAEKWELWIRKNEIAKTQERDCENANSLTETTTEITTEITRESGQKPPAPPEPPKAEKPAKAKADLFPVVTSLSEVCQMPFEINRGRLFREAKQLCAAAVVPPVTPDEVRARYGAGGWWYREDWRGQKGEPPTPAAIRGTWGQWTKAKVIPITRAKPTKAYTLAQIQAQWDEEDGITRDDQSDSPIIFEHIPTESGRSAERGAFAAGMAGRAGRCT